MVLCAVSVVLVMSPWWIRNARTYGRFVSTSIWLGASLYDGLNRGATGASNMDFRNALEFRSLDELNQDAILTRSALNFVRENPARVELRSSSWGVTGAPGQTPMSTEISF